MTFSRVDRHSGLARGYAQSSIVLSWCCSSTSKVYIQCGTSSVPKGVSFVRSLSRPSAARRAYSRESAKLEGLLSGSSRRVLQRARRGLRASESLLVGRIVVERDKSEPFPRPDSPDDAERTLCARYTRRNGNRPRASRFTMTLLVVASKEIAQQRVRRPGL